MKVTCTQEALARGLGVVGRAVAARSPLPITANVLLTSDGGRLKLAATNLEITMSCWIQANIEEGGGGTLPGRPSTRTGGRPPHPPPPNPGTTMGWRDQGNNGGGGATPAPAAPLTQKCPPPPPRCSP